MPEPTVSVGQVALVINTDIENDSYWVLLHVSDVGPADFGYSSYAIGSMKHWISGVNGRHPFEDVIAAFDPTEAVELEKVLRRFEKNQEGVLAVYRDARKAFIQALRSQNETAMANLLQDSEKLNNEIADLVSKFGVNVALFKEP